MLKLRLLHPDILMALGSNGHGSQILIADGNYPFSTGTPSTCKKVFLNLAPDMLTVTDVLRVIKDYIPIDASIVMVPADGSVPPIHHEFQSILGKGVDFVPEKRFDFYKQAQSENTCLLVATGDTRRFANIIIVVGCIK